MKSWYDTWQKQTRGMAKRKYQVYRTNRDRTYLKDYGIWKGSEIWEHLDDDRYQEPYDSDLLYNLKVGQELFVSLLTWQDEGDYYIKVKRVPNNTVIPDTRGWFDKVLHFIFRMKPYHME